MIKKIYLKLQTKEGLMLVISVGIIVVIIGLLARGVFSHKKSNYGFNDPAPVITISGTGEINAVPDIALFTYSISKDAATIAEARNQVATTGNDLFGKLKAAGIAEKDIKTDSLSTYPKYENRASATNDCGVIRGSELGIMAPVACAPVYNSVVVGYTVTTTFSVKVRDLDQVSAIATLLTNAKLFSLNGPNFSIDNRDELVNEARQKAIKDAKKEAEMLASQLGVRLVGIVNFSEDGYNPAPMYYDRAGANAMMSSEKSVAPELPAGETIIRSNVTITYRIK